jgi:hypothetical protein
MFLAHLERLSPQELRFVVEALHDGAVTAQQEALGHPGDSEPCMARVTVLNGLWTRLLNDVNARNPICVE